MTSDQTVVTLDAFRELLGSLDVAMLTTVDTNGRLGCRPMAARPLDALQPLQLWFLTRVDTDAARQVGQRSQVCVSYQSNERNLYVVVHGRAEEVRDDARLRATWRPIDSVFFPEGPGSDQLCLIRVFPQAAEVWQGPAGLVGKAVAFAQALATGDPAALGRHSDVRL